MIMHHLILEGKKCVWFLIAALVRFYMMYWLPPWLLKRLKSLNLCHWILFFFFKSSLNSMCAYHIVIYRVSSWWHCLSSDNVKKLITSVWISELWNHCSQKRQHKTEPRSIQRVWNTESPVISLWCPAGGESYRVTAQMVLVCCWRSMKEVAMLLGQLCHSMPLHCPQDLPHTREGLISREQVRSETTAPPPGLQL